MADKITVKQANDVNEPNAYYVTVEDLGETVTHIVNTNEHGRGLWIDGKQREGIGQFSVGKRPGEDYRRYFQYITK